MSDQAVPFKPITLPITPVRRKRRFGVAGRLLAVSTLVILASGATYPFLPRTYSATSALLIRPTNQEGATTWDQSVADAIDDNAIQTKIDILRSDPLQADVLDQGKLMLDPEFNGALTESPIRQVLKEIPALAPLLPPKKADRVQVISAVAKHLIVTRERKSYLIHLGYWSTDAIKSATLTNLLVKAFQGDQVGRKRESHQALLTALGDSIDILELRYHADEKHEYEFAVRTGLVNVGERDSLMQQLTALSTAVAEAHRRTVDTAARAQMLARQSQNLGATTEALSSPLLQHLRERYVELSSGAGSTAAPLGANNLVVNVLRERIETETHLLVLAAQNDALVACQEELNLRAEIERINDKLLARTNNQRLRDDLHRAVQSDLEALQAANTRYMQEAGRGDVIQPDIEVVAPAGVPDLPSFPDLMPYAVGTIALVVLLDGLILLPTIMRRATRSAGARRAH